MSLASLWLILFHALTGTAVLSVQPESGPAVAATQLAATPRQMPSESIRASYANPISAFARPTWRSPASVAKNGVPDHPHDTRPCFDTAAIGRAATGQREKIQSFPSDERLFPYFPTAPPRTPCSASARPPLDVFAMVGLTQR